MRKLAPVLALLLLLIVGAALFVVFSGDGDAPPARTGDDPAASAEAEQEPVATPPAHAVQESKRWVPRGDGSLVGVVLEYGTDRPLANIAVSLEAGLPGPDRILRTVTGDDGAFRFDAAVNFDDWMLRVVPPAPLAELVMGGVEVVEERESDVGTVYVTAGYEVPGIVVDEFGEPVEGASVRALRPRPKGSTTDFLRLIRELPQRPSSVDSATTAADGTFVLTKIPPGRYDFELSAAGRALRIERNVMVSPEQGTGPLRFVIAIGYDLPGRVVRTSGAPVEGLQVVAFEEPRGESGLFELDKSFATTDADGAFRLRGLAAGQVMVVAIPEGEPFAVKDAVPVPGTDFVEIVIQGDAWLHGRVTNTSDEPVADAEIYVVSTDGGTPVVGNTLTAADGTYRIDGLRSGPVQVFLVQASGYATYPEDLFAALRGGGSGLNLSPGENTQDAQLSGGGTVRGVVLSQSDDAPVPGVRVSLLSAQAFFGGTRGATTDAEGRFEIANLPKGGAVLLAEKEGWFQPGVTPQTIGMMMMGEFRGGGARQTDTGRGAKISISETGEVVERELRLARGSTVRGRVLDPDGAPVAGAQVSVQAADLPRMFGPLAAMLRGVEPKLSKADGTFEIPGPPPGQKAKIVARAAGWLDGSGDEFTAAVGQDVEGVEVRLRRGAVVEGVVRDTEGKPLPAALVRWIPGDDANPWSTRWTLGRATPVSTDANGRFRAESVEPGKLIVQVKHPRHLSVSRSDVVVEDGKSTTLDFQLAAGASITGTVLGPDGRPRAGGRVAIGRDGDWQRPDDAYAAEPEPVSSDAQGTFRFEGLPPGKFTLTARGESAAPSAPAVVEAGASGVTLRLVTAYEISGTVRYTDGTPAVGARVNVVARQADGTPGDDEAGSDTTGGDGSFRIRELPGGTYDVHVGQGWWGGDRAAVVPRTIESVEAGRSGLVIEVTSGLRIVGRVLLPDGSPASEGWVWCSQVLEPSAQRREPVSASGAIADGSFELKGLVEGEYQLNVNVPEYGQRALRAAAGAEDIEIRFTDGATISGRVTMPDGSAASGVNVWVQSPNGGTNAQTDENGRYTAAHVAPGKVTVMAMGNTGDGKPLRAEGRELEVQDGSNETNVDLTLAPFPTGEGR